MAKRGPCRTDQLSRISWKASVYRRKRYWWSATANQWLAILFVGKPSKKKIGSKSSTWLLVGEVGAKASPRSWRRILVGRGSREAARFTIGDRQAPINVSLWSGAGGVGHW